jgi:hypothetical protein
MSTNRNEVDKEFAKIVTYDPLRMARDFIYTLSALTFFTGILVLLMAIWATGGVGLRLVETSILSMTVSLILFRLGIWVERR